MSADPGAPGARPSLKRALSARDVALLTMGAVIGTGIFLTPGGVVAAVGAASSPWVWLAGGLLTLAGALTYAELGAMYPRAGGLYHFLKEAYGPVWGFLYGWTCLLVIMSGGIAAIAVGFGEYLGAFVPAFSSTHVVFGVGGGQVNGAQLAAVAAIVVLTAVNHVGLEAGATLQAVFTVAKLGAVAALIGFGLAVPSIAAVDPSPAASSAVGGLALASGLGAAMVAALWTYDGWYAATFSAGEVKRPERALPLGLIAGVATVSLLYFALAHVYLRALPEPQLAASARVAEDAARALFGEAAARAMTLAVVVSAFGCLAATILYSSRVYQPMAADRVFFARVAEIHPKWRTPVAALWLQSAWAIALTLTGSYTQLFTFVTFGGVLFHVGGGLALFRLRAIAPRAPRPYRAALYPLVPAVFVAGMVLLTLSTLASSPRESVLGLGLIAAGLPAYVWWRRRG